MDEFQQAHEKFLQQLPVGERARFVHIKSSKELLDEFSSLGDFQKKHPQWTKLFRSVEKCSKKLDPYFDVVGITIQSHPEWAAIAWGAIRLVLLIASNYGTFFSKLADLFEQLSAKLPSYSSLTTDLEKAKAVVQTTEGFQESLRAVYGDLFELLRGITRVFTKNSGKPKRAPHVIGDLLWHPFDVRFANILDRFKMHCDILEFERKILHFKMSGSILGRQAEERARSESQQRILLEHCALVSQMKRQLGDMEKQSVVERISAWINPTSYAEALGRFSAAREEGTAEWIFHQEEYKKWLREDVNGSPIPSTARFLWVQGNPGVGKSVLAASAIQELMNSSADSQISSPLVTFFFFEYNANHGRPAPRDFAYRAILAQLLHHFQYDKDILEIITFAMWRRQHGQLTATNDELVDLLRMLASHITCWYLVIDGVDECADSDDLLQELSKALGDQLTKVLLLSRPNVRFLRHKIPKPQIVTVNRLHNEMDLRLYFDTRLSKLQDLGIIPNSASRPLLVDHLLTGADGMFIWAKLMMAHLQSNALSQWQRLNIITKLRSPERIEDLYNRILRSLTEKLLSEQSLARRIFLWLTFAKTTISAIELQDILLSQGSESSDPPTEIRRRAKEDDFIDFEHTVVMVTGSLVEKRLGPSPETATFSFTHISVMEFFESRCKNPLAAYGSEARTVQYFLPAIYEAEAELTVACVSYIFQRVPGKPLSGNMFEASSKERLCDSLPFVSYAAKFWPRHLTSTRAPLNRMREPNLGGLHRSIEAIITILRRFLLNRLLPMVWIELLYTFGTKSPRHEELQDALLQWSEWARGLKLSALPSDEVETPSALAAFARDLTKLHTLWGDTLLTAPHQMWNDVTAFTSSPFFVATSAVSVKFLASESFCRAGLSTTPLSKISRDDPSTDFLAVLTIWPSWSFELQWRKAATRSQKRKATCTIFEGWIAQYEIWNIKYENPVTVESSRIALESTEVQVQYERFRKYVQSSGKQISTQAAGKELALHFPSSIDSDLNTFTVLRTIFKRRQTMPLGSNPICTDNCEERWRSILIPVEHTAHATLLHGLPKSQKPEGETIPRSMVVASNRPTPAFRLTVFCKYVLYQSLDGREALGENEDTAGTIAIYRVTTLSRERDEVRLLGCIEGESNRGAISHCVFHPENPLLAFHYQPAIGSSKVFIWCFQNDDSPDPGNFIVLRHDLLQLGSSSGICPRVATIPAAARVKSLQFSGRGGELSYELYNRAHQESVSIDDFPAYQLSERLGKSGTSGRQLLSQSRTELSPQSFAMTRANALPHSLRVGQEVLHTDGGRTSLSFDAGGSNRSVKLVHRRSGVEKEQSLLSLPAWEDIKNVSVSIRTPSTRREDKVTIILNKTAQPFYVLRKGSHITAPAIVRKDVRAIMPPKQIGSLGTKEEKLSVGWSGISYDEEDSGGEGRLSKKARIGDV